MADIRLLQLSEFATLTGRACFAAGRIKHVPRHATHGGGGVAGAAGCAALSAFPAFPAFPGFEAALSSLDFPPFFLPFFFPPWLCLPGRTFAVLSDVLAVGLSF